jgi:hypothetical protein
MKRAFLLFTALLIAACEHAPVGPDAGQPSFSRAGRNYAFTTIEVPGALSTAAAGISAAGDIVGQWVDSDFVFHGFVLSKGIYTTLDYPGAEGTSARGISPSGEIVGTYWLPGEPGVAAHGFHLTRDGQYHQLDYPGHINNIPQRILADGTILGCRHDEDTMGSMVGVVMGRGGNSEISAFASMHNGATPDLRRIAGLYLNTTSNQTEGYVIDDGVFKPFMVPGSIFTAAWDVNPAGQVAGIYRNGTGFHGFVMTSDDNFVTIDFPGAAATRAFGINAGGDVVGSYVAGGKTYGFLASATRQHNQ